MGTKAVTLELRRFAVFTGGFFTALSLLVGSVPHLLEFYDVLPYTPEPERPVTWLASVIAIAVAGSGFLVAQSQSDVSLERSTGIEWLLLAVGTAVFYLSFALEPNTTDSSVAYLPKFHVGIMMLLYLVTFGLLSKGFFTMALYAYALPNVRPNPIFRRLREQISDWQATRRERAEFESQKRQAQARDEHKKQQALAEKQLRAAKEMQAAQAARQRTIMVLFFLITLLLSLYLAFPHILG